ncbi:MAG: hypothetical protein JW957_00965 [Candidatus Omnitrophica bacterium]|nr:hypothetical protein [Candidatus Omnitrophota bacterium]
MKEKILIFGAGALSLGFLGPLLSEDYDLIFCDVAIKKDLIRFLRKEHQYSINVCSDKIVPTAVCGVTAFNLSDKAEKEEVKKILQGVKIVFTAVGTKGIDETMSFIRENGGKGRSRKLYVFSAENDKGAVKRWTGETGENVQLCDTIMGRMCRIDYAGEKYRSIFPDFDEAVIAEDFYGLPVLSAIHSEADLQGAEWQAMPEREFEAKSRLKLFGHNGAHAYLSYFGFLQGLKYFYESDSGLLTEAESFLDREIIPSLLKSYGDVFGGDELEVYCKKLISRITSRTFADTIERGTRDSLKKITSGERLAEGAAFVLKNGIAPEYFCRIISAGIMINVRGGLLFGSPDKIISEDCKIKDKELAVLIKKAMQSMTS